MPIRENASLNLCVCVQTGKGDVGDVMVGG